MIHQFRSLLYNINKYIYSGNKFYCNICNRQYRKLLSAGNNYRRENVRCPGCGSLERHRFMMYYLEDRTNIFSGNKSVLDIAPLHTFNKLFSRMKNINYTSIDLNLPYVTLKADLTNLPFKDETFDCILCYHVLEHIEDDIRALSEMYRVLKYDGWAIIQSPMDKSLSNTLQYPGISSPEEREKAYGQYDHVRIYGNDFTSRIESVGFVVKVDNYINKFSPDEIKKFSLDKGGFINLCSKY